MARKQVDVMPRSGSFIVVSEQLGATREVRYEWISHYGLMAHFANDRKERQTAGSVEIDIQQINGKIFVEE